MKRTNSVSSGRIKKIPPERPADRSEKITGVCAAVCAVICAAALCFFSVGTLTGEKKRFCAGRSFRKPGYIHRTGGDRRMDRFSVFQNNNKERFRAGKLTWQV